MWTAEKDRNSKNMSKRKARQNASDSYIKELIRMTGREPTKDLIRAWRENLLLKRERKNRTDIDETRYCPTCKIGKPLSEFYPQRTGHSRLAHECKICVKKRVRAWQTINREKINRAHCRYRQSAKGKEAAKAYLISRREHLKEYRHSYWNEHREQRKIIVRKSRAKTRRELHDPYIRNLVMRECRIHYWEITDDQIRQWRTYFLLTREIRKAKEAINGTGN